jgi:hypothetical protein
MWTLITSIDFRAAKRRAAKAVVTATVLVGTGTQVAMALYPAPAAASREPSIVSANEAAVTDAPTVDIAPSDGA